MYMVERIQQNLTDSLEGSILNTGDNPIQLEWRICVYMCSAGVVPSTFILDDTGFT